MKKLFLFLLTFGVLQLQGDPVQVISFNEPIDAVSFGMATDEMDMQISAEINETWTDWQALEIEKEFDPLLRESSLAMFPEGTSKIRVKGNSQEFAVHPIRVSKDPVQYAVAALTTTQTPKILSRSQWGADEIFLVEGTPVSRSDVVAGDNGNGGEVSQRVKDCEQAQLNYPDEFKTLNTVRTNAAGQTLRWAQSYSQTVKLLVVHHTALTITGDARPPVERMRALYEYHANNRGWGDIGYHYLIDENGQIYEGRAGGDKTVGGHVYCGNVGTVGVALMGNFNVEKPTQSQMQSLTWLLSNLAEKYKIDISKSALFHGKIVPPILGHGDLIATECPGYYVEKTISQVRIKVLARNFDTPIVFPSLSRKYADKTSERKNARLTSQTNSTRLSSALTLQGESELTVRPGGQDAVVLQFRAGTVGLRRGDRIAGVTRSHPRIGLWQVSGAQSQRIRDELRAPKDIKPGESLFLTLRIQSPQEEGTYDIQVGDILLTLHAEGRSTPSGDEAPRPQTFVPSKNLNTRLQSAVRKTSEQSPTVTSSKKNIRIRLGYTGLSATIQSSNAIVNGKPTTKPTIDLAIRNGKCEAFADDVNIASGIVRIDSNDTFVISSWNKPANQFRGVLECQVVNGELVLINELNIEDYLKGLAEEPDTEPFEKQRAFAVAARSYATHYTDPNYRKFSGLPYDGDDSPARFQMYGGVYFEERNPEWVRAVESTSTIVLKKNNQVVKAAYFSSDDGRTRSPAENSWANFLFAEIFESKPDPWCKGMPLHGHGVGMSGCGAEGQANEGKTAEDILRYYYTNTTLEPY